MNNYTHLPNDYNPKSNNRIRVLDYKISKTQLLFLRPNKEQVNNYFNRYLTTYYGVFNIINGHFTNDDDRQFPALYFGSSGYKDLSTNDRMKVNEIIKKWWNEVTSYNCE